MLKNIHVHVFYKEIKKEDEMKGSVVLGFVIVLIIFLFVMIRTDYHLAKQDKQPKFAIETRESKEKDVLIYKGFGYHIVDFNQVKGRNDVVFVPFYSEDRKKLYQ